MMKMLHSPSNSSPSSSHPPHRHHLHLNHQEQQQPPPPTTSFQQQNQSRQLQSRRPEEENLYSSPSMERKRMITRKEQEELDKLLKDMIEELETFPEYSTTTYRTQLQQPSAINHNNTSRFQRNTSQTRSFSHSPSVRSPAAIISYNSTLGQSSRSTPLTADVTDSPQISSSTSTQHTFNQSHHPLSLQPLYSQPQSQQNRQKVTQATIHNHTSHPQHNQTPSITTSISSSRGTTSTMKGEGGVGGITSAGQPYCNIYGSKSIPGQSEYTYGQVKPPPPLQLKYQPANATLYHHHAHHNHPSSSSPTYSTITGHNDDHDYIGYTRSTPCCAGGGQQPGNQTYSTIQRQQQPTIPVMPVAPPYITKQHDIPSYSPAPSRSSAKSVTLTPAPKPVTLQQTTTGTSRSTSPIRTTRVIPGAKIDLEDHDRSGVYASVLGKKSLSRNEREELDELVNVMMEEVRNFPDYTPGTMSKRGTPFRRSVSHGSGVSRQNSGGGQQQPGSTRMSRMESRSPTRSFTAASSLNRFNDRSTSWNRGMLRDTNSPGRCSRILEQGSHGHGHSHGPGGVQCGIANGGIVKPVSPLPPHLLTRPTQWIEDEVTGGHRKSSIVTPYHARADSKPFTYGVTPATAYPVLQQRRHNTESTAYIVENNPRPEHYTTFRAPRRPGSAGGGPPGDGSSSRSSHFTSGPNIPVVQNVRVASPGAQSAIYAVPRGYGNHHNHHQEQEHREQDQQHEQHHHHPHPQSPVQLQQQSRSYSSTSNDPRHEQQQQQQQSSSSSSLPKITYSTSGQEQRSEGGGRDGEVEHEDDEVFPKSVAGAASYSKSIDSGLSDLSWLQKQQNKLKVRRSSLDSHDRKVREDMLSELAGTVSGRKIPAINDSSRESSPPNHRPKSPQSPKRVRSPGLKVSFDS